MSEDLNKIVQLKDCEKEILGASVSLTESPQASFLLPAYIYTQFRNNNALPALAAFVMLKEKFKKGNVWKENLSKRKLGKILGISPSAAYLYKNLLIREGLMQIDANGAGNLISLKTNQKRAYNLLTIKIENYDLTKIKEAIDESYIVLKIKQQNYNLSKKETLKHKRQGGGFQSNESKGLFLSCEKLGQYMGVSAGEASKRKGTFKGVSFERNREKLGQMEESAYKALKEANKDKGKHYYRNPLGFVIVESCASVSLGARAESLCSSAALPEQFYFKTKKQSGKSNLVPPTNYSYLTCLNNPFPVKSTSLQTLENTNHLAALSCDF